MRRRRGCFTSGPTTRSLRSRPTPPLASAAPMAEIVEGLGGSERERIASLRRDGHFFWVDLDANEVSRDELDEALGIDPHALDPLLDFGREIAPSRKFHADGEHVVFPFNVFIEAESIDESLSRLEPIEVHV